MLEDYRASNEWDKTAKWDLQDLDLDSVPELLISEGASHVCSVQIYFFADGKAFRPLDDSGDPLLFGTYGGMLVCPMQRLVCCTDVHMGYYTAVIRSVENQKLVNVKVLTDDTGAVGEDEATYRVNDTVVDKETYQKELDEFDAIDWTEAGSRYSFDDFTPLT